MEELSTHIRTLLRDHDRAFIPGFGGFVKERVPARIDRDRDLFLPPSCTLSFNQSLDKEDGLLAEQILRTEGTDFENAKRRIREAADEWKESLHRFGRIELEGIGILYRDEEDRTHFEPDPEPELEPSGYGLPSFYVRPVRKMTPIPEKDRDEQEEREKKPPFEEEEKKEERRGPMISTGMPLKRIAAVVIPLLLVIGFGAIRMKVLQEGANFSELFWIGNSEEAHYVPRNESSFPSFTVDFPEKEEKELPFRFRLEPDGRDYMVVRDNTAVAENEKASKDERASYFVVGGCFEVKANAKGRVKRLERNGFPARILDRKRNGLHVVAFDAYSEKENALEGLTKARGTMPKAWLLHWP